jgi:hypothetical protein
MVCVYGEPTCPPESEEVVTAGIGLITTVYAWELEFGSEAAVTVKWNLPVAVGMPLIVPDTALSDKPCGNSPLALHTQVTVQPVAVRACE